MQRKTKPISINHIIYLKYEENLIIMNYKEIKTKFSLSPELNQNSQRLVPLRNRIPKHRIKEVPGWHLPTKSPNLMKVTSIKPYKVKNKRDFYSPLFFATDERIPFILQSKSSQLLPRLAKNKNLNWNSMKMFNHMQVRLPESLQTRSRAIFNTMLKEDQESEIDSSPMRPLFSHRSQDPPVNPEVKFLTEKSSVSLNFAEKVNRTQGSSTKLNNFYISSGNQCFFEEISEFEIEQRNSKSSQESRKNRPFFMKGVRLELMKDGRAKSVDRKKRGEFNEKELAKIMELRNELGKEFGGKKILGTELPKVEKTKFKAERDSLLVSRNQVKSSEKNLHKIDEKKDVFNSEGSEEEDFKQTDDKQKANKSRNQLNSRKRRLYKESSYKSDSSLSSAYSGNQKRVRKARNTSGVIESDDQEKSKAGHKMGENVDRAKDELREIIKTEEKNESDGSVTYSPKITKRLLNPNTVTPVTNHSNSAHQTPVLKSPEPKLPINSLRQSQFRVSKESTKIRPNNRRPTIIESDSEKHFKKAKINQESKSKLAKVSKTLKSNTSPSNKNNPKPKNQSKKIEKTEKVENSLLDPTNIQNDPDQNIIQSSNNSKISIKQRTKYKKTKNFKSKLLKKTSKNVSNRNDSLFSDESKLEIRITEAPEIASEFITIQNPEFLQNGFISENEHNLSNISRSSGYLHVRRNTKNPEENEKSRSSSRNRQRPLSKTEHPNKSRQSRRTKNPEKTELSRKSGKSIKKELKNQENILEDDSFISSGSNESGFSKYSVIKKAEMDQKFLGKSETLGKKPSKHGMMYLKNFVANEVKKKLKALDPVSNFIFNFSFSILKSIKSLIRVNIVSDKNKRLKKKNTKALVRIETELFDKEALGKGKLKTNKKSSVARIEPQKSQPPNSKLQKKFLSITPMYYPREITLKAMHSRKNSEEKSVKKGQNSNLTTKKFKGKAEKNSDSESSESESSESEPVVEDKFTLNRSKKSLLYEISHQELVFRIAKQIISNNEENEGNNSSSTFSEVENSSDISGNNFDFQDQINELAIILKASPKSFAFGPEINFNLLKQNQILFDFKELEKGKYDIDFENLKRFSKKQEFLGMQKLESESNIGFSQFELQIKPDDNLTDEQQYRKRIQKMRFTNKRLKKIKEKLLNPDTFSSPSIDKRPLLKSKSPNLVYSNTEFEERVYLRLRDASSPQTFNPYTKH